MLLDQPTNYKKKITIDGNNNLLRATIFSVINLVWFFFLFAFINIEWKFFSPFAPWIYGAHHKYVYTFYFICFSFFIASLIFSLIFFRSTIHPTELLFRFALILVTFTAIYIIWSFAKHLFMGQSNLAIGGLVYVFKEHWVENVIAVLTRFITYFFLFYLLILFFSKLLYNGDFGIAGLIMSVFLSALFLVVVYLLAKIEPALNNTRFTAADFAVVLFFTLLGFGIGLASGKEPLKKKKKGKRTF